MKIKNIFLVEDDDFFAATFVKRLEKAGDFEIHRFFDCEHALRELLNVKPEIVFLDHKMKGLDGVDALPLFLENLPSVEVAIVSGQTDPEVLKKAMDRGASHYFQKDVLLMKHAEGFIESLNNKKSKLSSFWNTLFKYEMKLW